MEEEEKEKIKDKKTKKRSVWIEDWVLERAEHRYYNTLMVAFKRRNPRKFKNLIRMTPKMFSDLKERLTPRLTKRDTNIRKALEVGLKLAITLCFYARGDSYHSLGYQFYVPHNTISLIVRDVSQAIIDEYGAECVKCPQTQEEWKEVAEIFGKRWNFLHTCGAIDGKHFAITKPSKSGSMYHNYKGFFSIIMLSLVDADYKFIWNRIGIPGANCDAAIFNEIELCEGIEGGWANLPVPDPLPHDLENQNTPYFLIGDDAFAIRTWMMKPYGGVFLTKEECIFNYRLSRARRVVENAFGILVKRFAVFKNTMLQKPETCAKIIMACVCLHNYIRIHSPQMDRADLDLETTDHTVIKGAWRKHLRLDPLKNVGYGKCATKEGRLQRDVLKVYYNSTAGSVPWQDRMITRPYTGLDSDLIEIRPLAGGED